MRGFVRISAAVPVCRVADFEENFQNTLDLWRQSHEQGEWVSLCTARQNKPRL